MRRLSPLLLLNALTWAALTGAALTGCDDSGSDTSSEAPDAAAEDTGGANADGAADPDAAPSVDDAAVGPEPDAAVLAPDAEPPPDGPAWPGDEWASGDPADHGIDPEGLEAVRAYTFQPANDTQALVVIKDGIIVGEWYADGADADTRVTSWSVAKSFTSALVGIGLREGVLTLDDAVGTHLDAWAEGPNAAITVRNLIEMRSGLTESAEGDGIYGAEPDQLAYALNRSPVRLPGTQFEYVNEDSMVLGGVISAAFGRQAHEVAESEIFAPLGMAADWWTDGEGHTLGYCCIDSTARSFARFGLLYARGGAWDGEQIVPGDYVDASTTGIALNGAYGMHWWTFGGPFSAIGLHDQYITVAPESDLVVVRFSSYQQIGTERVRAGNNYHQTRASAFDSERFFALLVAMLTE